MNPARFAPRLALVAGSMDFLTGLGLLLVPELTLRLMRVAPPVAPALIYVRFVGAFVWAVGAAYLWALAAPGPRLRSVLAVTVLPRAAAGCFTGCAVATGSLAWPWLTVTVTDLALAAIQVALLRRRKEPA